MPYKVVIFAWRKPGISPSDFKQHYENSHVPLIQSLTGNLFPDEHIRHYIQRSLEEDGKSYPATVLIGEQEDFGYDSYSELVFKDEEAFQAFFACVSQPENAAKLAEDEKHFLDRPKMKVAVSDVTNVTNRKEA